MREMIYDGGIDDNLMYPWGNILEHFINHLHTDSKVYNIPRMVCSIAPALP